MWRVLFFTVEAKQQRCITVASCRPYLSNHEYYMEAGQNEHVCVCVFILHSFSPPSVMLTCD